MISCLEFFCKITDELIDNNEGICMTWVAAEQDVGGVVNAANAATPTVKSTLRFKSGKVKRRNQGRCSIKGCTKHSVYVCSVCTHATDAAQKQFWFCNPTTVGGSDCFAKHIAWHREQENGGAAGATRTRGGIHWPTTRRQKSKIHQLHNSITFIKKRIMCLKFSN